MEEFDVSSLCHCVGPLPVLKYCVAKENSGKLVTEGEGLIVSYHYRNNQKETLPCLIRVKIVVLERSVLSIGR